MPQYFLLTGVSCWVWFILTSIFVNGLLLFRGKLCVFKLIQFIGAYRFGAGFFCWIILYNPVLIGDFQAIERNFFPAGLQDN